ncbi:MAG TPA: hypothetical protein VNH22_03790 [Blastocatellia bacterium]|jgi:hypothetical protein|nr:hypothetical protein [Blastocatellia bacterium]
MLRTALVVFLLVSCFACSITGREAPPEDAEKAGAQFFERLKGAQYDVIYNDAATILQKEKARLAVADDLKKVTALGKVRDYKRKGANFAKEGEKSFAVVNYDVTFEQTRGEATLQFVDVKGEWKLSGYSFGTRGASNQ